MKTKNLLDELPLVFIALIPIVYILSTWNILPNEIPIHFDMNGNPNGYGPKWVIIAMSAGLYLLMLVLPKIDPRKASYTLFADSYFKLRLILGLFFTLINCSIIYGVLHQTSAINKMMPLSIFFLFILIGNYMGNIRQNYFVGIKVPWTLNNEEVWKRTHKFAGILWFWGGLLGCMLFFFVENFQWIMIPILIIVVVVPIVYSYVIYQKIVK